MFSGIGQKYKVAITEYLVVRPGLGILIGMKPKVLIMRAALGLLFAFLLVHFFFPTAGVATTIIAAAVLVFFAYVFEAIHRREK